MAGKPGRGEARGQGGSGGQKAAGRKSLVAAGTGRWLPSPQGSAKFMGLQGPRVGTQLKV